jgi:hypothetical protein
MEIFPALVCPTRWDKLLACTDGSAEGQNAVAVTLELAQACGSQVQVVQVLEVAPEYQAAEEVQKIWRPSKPRPPSWGCLSGP